MDTFIKICKEQFYIMLSLLTTDDRKRYTCETSLLFMNLFHWIRRNFNFNK